MVGESESRMVLFQTGVPIRLKLVLPGRWLLWFSLKKPIWDWPMTVMVIG